jgi:hypothetical protein
MLCWQSSRPKYTFAGDVETPQRPIYSRLHSRHPKVLEQQAHDRSCRQYQRYHRYQHHPRLPKKVRHLLPPRPAHWISKITLELSCEASLVELHLFSSWLWPCFLSRNAGAATPNCGLSWTKAGIASRAEPLTCDKFDEKYWREIIGDLLQLNVMEKDPLLGTPNGVFELQDRVLYPHYYVILLTCTVQFGRVWRVQHKMAGAL